MHLMIRLLLRRLSNYLVFIPLVRSISAMGSIQAPQSSLEERGYHISGEDEIAAIDNILENTLHQLEMQKQMKGLMVEFLRQKKEFAEGNQTKAHAGRMVRMARQIYESITAHHLEYLFSQEYVDELLFFSSIAGKSKIKCP